MERKESVYLWLGLGGLHGSSNNRPARIIISLLIGSVVITFVVTSVVVAAVASSLPTQSPPKSTSIHSLRARGLGHLQSQIETGTHTVSAEDSSLFLRFSSRGSAPPKISSWRLLISSSERTYKWTGEEQHTLGALSLFLEGSLEEAKTYS